MGKWFQYTKNDFLHYLKSVDAKSIRFKYMGNVNDVWNPCGTLQKQAGYEFYCITNNKEIKLIVYKQHRRDHYTVQCELEKKYTNWFNKWVCNQSKNK